MHVFRGPTTSLSSFRPPFSRAAQGRRRSRHHNTLSHRQNCRHPILPTLFLWLRWQSTAERHSKVPVVGINKGAHGASCLTAEVKEQVSLSPRRCRQSVAMETDGRAPLSPPPRVCVCFSSFLSGQGHFSPQRIRCSSAVFQLGFSPIIGVSLQFALSGLASSSHG